MLYWANQALHSWDYYVKWKAEQKQKCDLLLWHSVFRKDKMGRKEVDKLLSVYIILVSNTTYSSLVEDNSKTKTK